MRAAAGGYDEGSERGVGAQQPESGMRVTDRQDERRREAGDQREEQEAETEGNPAPAYAPADRTRCLEGIASDIAPAPMTREHRVALFHKDRLSICAAARTTVTSSLIVSRSLPIRWQIRDPGHPPYSYMCVVGQVSSSRHVSVTRTAKMVNQS